MRTFTIKKTQTVTADTPLLSHHAALTKLNELLKKRYEEEVHKVKEDAYHCLCIEFDIDIDMDVELAHVERIIEESEKHAKQVKLDNENRFNKMQAQDMELSKTIDNYEICWSVPDVELDDVAITGKAKVVFRNYNIGDDTLCVDNPTWRELADIFNKFYLLSDDKGHYFMEGVHLIEMGVYQFIRGS